MWFRADECEIRENEILKCRNVLRCRESEKDRVWKYEKLGIGESVGK